MRSNRPVCGRCHEEIVGVVPVWLDDVPVCRNCAYSDSFNISRSRKKEIEDPPENKAGVRAPSRIRPAVGVFVLIVGITIMGLKTGDFVRALGTERPHYRGAVNLDRDAEACISNLWKITRLIQDEAAQWPNLACPLTGVPYRIAHVKGDSIVSCPNPERHDVTGIRVSRTSPVPEVEL